MNKLITIIVFAIAINISAGIIITAIPAFQTNDYYRGGLTYNPTFSSEFTTNMEQNVSPSGVLEDQGNAIYRVLDMLNLGFIQRLLGVVTSYTHGFVKILDNIIGRYLDPGVYTLLFGKPFGILYSLMTIIYIIFAWSLWTGKTVGDSY